MTERWQPYKRYLQAYGERLKAEGRPSKDIFSEPYWSNRAKQRAADAIKATDDAEAMAALAKAEANYVRAHGPKKKMGSESVYARSICDMAEKGMTHGAFGSSPTLSTRKSGPVVLIVPLVGVLEPGIRQFTTTV